MPVRWFIADYKRDTSVSHPRQYCVIADYQALITADGGKWSDMTIGKGTALAKVSASSATLQTIAADPAVLPIPAGLTLQDTLSSLTTNQKNVLRNKVLAMGYTAQEIQDKIGSDLGAVTLGQLLRFLATRWIYPRYDKATDTIVFDTGIEMPPPKTVDKLDAEV
jgi:3D (Asp-Asp-Asp) domain-containing protein